MDLGTIPESVLMNITTDHPQTLQITLTSPEGQRCCFRIQWRVGRTIEHEFHELGVEQHHGWTAPFTGNSRTAGR
ncbi:MAG: hypothetical protein R2818_01085 [Flavobacteriales bacterium]